MTAPVQVGPSSSNGGPVPSVQRLTPRLTQVLQLAAVGYSNKRIGDALGTTEHTVKSQMATILRRLQVDNRTQAVVTAGQLGLVALNGGPPSLEQMFNLVGRAERKGGLSHAEGERLREGLRALAAAREERTAEQDVVVSDLRRKCQAAREDARWWRQQAREAGGTDAQARDAVRRVAELAKRWKHIPAKRQAGASVLAAIANRGSDF